jgi:hypothetical protein
VQLVHDFCNLAALVARSDELVRGRRGLIDLEVRVACDFVGYQFENAFDVDLRAGFTSLLRRRPPPSLRYGRMTNNRAPELLTLFSPLTNIADAIHVLMNSDHDNVCVFNCRDRDNVDVLDRGAIAGLNSDAVNINGS